MTTQGIPQVRARDAVGSVALIALLPVWPGSGSAGYSEALAAIAGGRLGEAREACIEAAEAGDPECENAVGWLALQRPELGGPEAARRWFRRAAGRGHRRAMENLAFLWGRGLGGPADTDRAATLYRSARAPAPRSGPPPAAAPPAPGPTVSEERRTEARFRSGYADLLQLRTLHALREGAAEVYVHRTELDEAEAALAVLGRRLEAQGGNADAIRAAVENRQALVLRLLDRHARRFDPAVRRDAKRRLDRVRAAHSP